MGRLPTELLGAVLDHPVRNVAGQLQGRIELQIAGTIDWLEVGCCRLDLHGDRALFLGRFLAESGSPWPFD
ncbi:hypothetical protein PGQ11_010262 [Apiospora arundinis]|uniref:Uncharacterized protein n=1 Tax=Apiospora arundinis TaxID=335852 RepID=A0ABR2I9W9_9PEZI